MNGLMVRMQESADQNLGNVRTQLTLVVSDLAERVGSLSQDMMAAADKVAKQAQNSANQVLDQTGQWSEATARALGRAACQISRRAAGDFQAAGQSLLAARDFLKEVISAKCRSFGPNGGCKPPGAGVQHRACRTVRGAKGYQPIAVAGDGATPGCVGHSARLCGAEREAAGRVPPHFRWLQERDRRTRPKPGQGSGAIQSGLRDYNQSIENNFKEIVKISNPMISEAASFLQTQIDELSGQLEELSSVISTSMERVNGRAK